MAAIAAIRDWPRAWPGARPAAHIRERNIDFRVAEILGFEFSDDGEHDYLWLEKDGANTGWVAASLAAFAGVRPVDVGFAGRKDRRAVTRQWFSVRRPGGTVVDWGRLRLEGVSVLERRRHQRKLRRGAHKGNRFEIAVRLQSGETLDESNLGIVRDHGVPNYYGEQRFGIDGGNLELAERLAGGSRLSRNKRAFALSAARSFIFNEMLAARVVDGSWNTLTSGDRAVLDGSSSHFMVTNLDPELAARCEQLDIHPSAELWGDGSPGSDGAVAAQERLMAKRCEALAAMLENEAAAARRALRARVYELEWELSGDRLTIRFELARGNFATAVLREVSDYRVRPY